MKTLVQSVTYICLVSAMTYYVYAKFETKFWEEMFFFTDKGGGLLFAIIALKSAPDRKHREFAKILVRLFGIRLVWEIMAAIDWEAANSQWVMFVMFIFALILVVWTMYISTANRKKWV